MTRFRLAPSIVALTVATLAARPGVAQNQLWLEQFGSLDHDYTSGAAPDGAGGVFLSGYTEGGFFGPNSSIADAWIARYDGATGTQLWLRQLATSGDDEAHGVAPDGSGGAYVTGYTEGSLGGPFGGHTDVWLARYDSAGNQLWTRQLSSTGPSSYDVANAATTDGSGGVYVTGYTSGTLGGPSLGSNDAWVARFNSSGVQLWVRQLGSPNHEAARTAAPDGSGGVYIGGETMSSLGGQWAGGHDAWLAHYDAAGNQLWIRQLGAIAWDLLGTAAPDGSEGVYVGGYTEGSLAAPNAGFADAWLARYDYSGNQLWIRQFGTSTGDSIGAAAADGLGGVYVGGNTLGSLAAANAGGYDAWLAQYDSSGNRLWTRQFGTNTSDGLWAASPDGSGGVYLGGMTYGDLGAPNAGLEDAWIARYDGVGPPSTYCTASTTANGCGASISANASPSATFATPCVLNIANVEGQRQGLVFYGVDNTGFSPLPWSTGSSSFLCVKPPTQRTAIQNSGGAIASCNGTLSLDWNAFHAANPGALGAPFTAGSKVYAQGWFRDPPAPKSTNLSNAITLTVFP